MPLKLQLDQIDPVRNAILQAFPLQNVLQNVVGQILVDIEATNDPSLQLTGQPAPGAVGSARYTTKYRDRVWWLVRNWNGRGLAADLISGLLRVAPSSPDLQAIQRNTLRNVPAIETAVLQGIVAEHLTHVNAAEWVTTLLQRMRAVCRIDFNGFEPPGVGTGFLVRRDLVLTAYHVVERLISRAGSIDAALFAETAFCRFEYLNDGDRAGTVVKFMRPQWRMASSPPGGIEKIVGGAEPGENELDFALIRLDRDVEAEPFAFATTGAVEPDPLIVLQHPRRAPLRVAFGQMTAFNPNGTRLRHNAGTEAGSSGAPCLNQTLEVVGLHNATRYPPHGVLADYNTAVPILRIEQALLAKNIHIGPVVHT